MIKISRRFAPRNDISGGSRNLGLNISLQIERRDITMMGYQQSSLIRLYCNALNIDQTVRKNHPLRNIKKVVDFEFVYYKVANTYGGLWNVWFKEEITA